MNKNLDERQLLVRGKIFMHTTFVFVGLLLLEIILQGIWQITFFDGIWSKVMIILFANSAMSSEMVWRDVHPLPLKPKIVLHTILEVMGIIIIIAAIVEFTNGANFTAEKALSETAAMLLMGVLFLCGGVIYFIKELKTKSKKEEEN